MQWERIKFVNFDDFYKNRKIIRYYYKELPLEEKWDYKRFIYGDKLKENTTDRDCIWNFLNENEFSKKELQVRVTYRKFQKKKKLKKDKTYDYILDFEENKNNNQDLFNFLK